MMISLNSALWGRIDSAPLKSSLTGFFYSLSEWPEFNVLDYRYEFVRISAFLANQSLNKKELIHITGVNEDYVDYFLNTAYLLGILSLTDSREQDYAINSGLLSSFTEKLKSLFNINKSIF